MSRKEKILIMYSGYKPAKTYGGPVNSISNIIQALGKRYDFYVIASNHELKSIKRLQGIKYGWNRIEDANVKYLSEKELNIKNLYKEIEKILPDVIYLNSIFLYKFLISSLKYMKKYRVKIIIAPRGELCMNALKIRSVKKNVYLRLIQKLKDKNKIYWHSTSNEETKMIEKILNIFPSKIKQVEVMRAKNNYKIKDIEKKENELRCVFISRICEKKNLISAIKYVKKANDTVTLDIYGFKEDMKYWEACKKEIGNCGRIKYCGELEGKEVLNVFNKYQLFLFPTLSENYGHVIEESMVAGCPVLISDQTPWNDIMDSGAGFIVELGNNKKFVNILNDLSKLKNFEYQILRNNCINYIAKKGNYDDIVNKYIDLFDV